jgi:hypothetical protein
MAAKKKVTTTTIEDTDNEQNNNTGFTLRNASETYDDPLAEIDAKYPNANRKIKVGRWTPNGVRHVFSTTDLFDEDFLQEHYGGGKYVVRVFVDNVQQRSFEINVEDRPGTRPQNGFTDDPQPKPNVTNASANGNGGTGFGGLTEMLLMKLLDRAPAATSTSVSELAEVMKIAQGAQPQVGNGKEYMEGFKAGVEFASKITERATGGGDWKTTLIDAAKEALPLVAGAMGGAGSRVPATMQNAPIVIPNSGVQKPMEVRTPEMQIVYDTIQNLKSYAMAKTDPDLVIDWAIANATKPEVQHVIHFAFTNDFAAFAKVDPEIANEPYVTWFKLVYDGLRSAFNSADSVDDDNSGESGDARNVTPNANAGGSGRAG